MTARYRDRARDPLRVRQPACRRRSTWRTCRPRALPRQRVHRARARRRAAARAMDAPHRLLRQRGRPVHAAPAAHRARRRARGAWSRSCPRRRRSAAGAEPAVGGRAPDASPIARARAGGEASSSPSRRRTSRSIPRWPSSRASSFAPGRPLAGRGRRSDAPHPRGVPLRSRRHDDHDAGRGACSPSAAASARTSRISRSPACARSAWPPAT